jgi:putative copper resistance protein D
VIELLTIVTKALGYGGALAASGAVLFWLLVAEPGRRAGQMRPMLVWPALIGIVATLALVPLQAGFLGGGTFSGATDGTLLSLVFGTALGAAVKLRVIGLIIVLFAALPFAWTRLAAAFGAMLVALSFSLVGHTLAEPRAVLSVLIAIHALAVAFWIGSLGPLHRIMAEVSTRQAADVAERFGRIAIWVVAVLVACGGLMLVLLTGGNPAVLGTLYGQIFMVKLAWVLALIALAAKNRLVHTRDMKVGSGDASEMLLRSIRWEMAVVAVILVASATVTTIAAPQLAG